MFDAIEIEFPAEIAGDESVAEIVSRDPGSVVVVIATPSRRPTKGRRFREHGTADQGRADKE
ncbi:MAG: hypothetical protein CMO80_15200 [Verrucomicrobiales bacterium]|nr:hypothetical protein [Verrucomicrobiales bacterium]